MSAAGVVYKDLVSAEAEQEYREIPREQVTQNIGTAQTLHEKPTDSHALAVENHADKGFAQLNNMNEVVDLGWNEPKGNVESPLVGGLHNEDLWVLVRRFNQQMYHVKETPIPPPGGLDLNIADEEEFSPDKLRSNMERLYMTIGIGVMGFVKHMARLRSWRETKRTGWFCTAYFVAWAFDLLVPLVSITLITLIVYPASRPVLFPPAPMALVDKSSGGVQKPIAGTLGSKDSATGAPENHKGEAVEAEASNFVNGLSSIAFSSATGKHPQGEPDSDEASPQEGKVNALGRTPPNKTDKTRIPVETVMWQKVGPVMHAIADITDAWERFANALSPTSPFDRNFSQWRLVSLVAPMLLLSTFVTSYMFVKGVTFGIGFGFFGDPILQRGFALLNEKVPNWQKYLELRNTLLKGVPTNAQLTITLLRIGEANKAPLPPPPKLREPPPEKPDAVTEMEMRAHAGENGPLEATHEEVNAAVADDPTEQYKENDEDKTSKHGKKTNKLLGFFKGTAKGAVETARGTDKLRAELGSKHAKEREGVVINPTDDLKSGPVEFKARYNGKKGHVYITTSATIPCVAFSTDSTIEKVGTAGRTDLSPIWSIPVGDIRELKKIGGYGWKAKFVVSWALDKEVADGLEITTKTGEHHKVTALPMRDELFNRLISMGGQKWESW
ncbi:hypothetical protein GQ43DRAFT_437575 [Delitschia confertaspora ATCC 74209]|uniref:Uncharacterized protein n=1 Tax=Delitschia confertaspora ATCC 74209 TaxID=1513339 RepID=A0A9P4JUW7_9PLEO|nr:hypothetical protein GQ43DRAFT_437575 [Delitschia confertaspora ATCC 74209]